MINHAFTHKLGTLLRNVDNQMARDALERRAILHYIQDDRIPDILEDDSSIIYICKCSCIIPPLI